MGLSIFVARNNKTLGPFPEEQVRDLYAKGKIQPQDHLWAEGFDSWKPASEYFGVSSGLGRNEQVAAAIVEEVPPLVTPGKRSGSASTRAKKRSEEIDVSGSLFESEKTLTLVAYIFAGIFWVIFSMIWIVPTILIVFRSGLFAGIFYLAATFLPVVFFAMFFIFLFLLLLLILSPCFLF